MEVAITGCAQAPQAMSGLEVQAMSLRVAGFRENVLGPCRARRGCAAFSSRTGLRKESPHDCCAAQWLSEWCESLQAAGTCCLIEIRYWTQAQERGGTAAVQMDEPWTKMKL